MFLKAIKERIKEVITNIDGFERRLSTFNERVVDLENRPQVDIQKFNNDIEKKLVEFHREITTRYFDTLEKILRVHTESSIITALAHNIDQRSLDNLKSSLLQPFLEAKWKNDREKDGERIINSGEDIIKTRDDLHKQMLGMEKQGQDISKIKIQVETYNEIIGRIKV
jgi:hypothetical protein